MNNKIINYNENPKIVGVKTGLGQVNLNLEFTQNDVQMQNIMNPKLYSVDEIRIDLVSTELSFDPFPNAIITDYIKFSPYLKYCEFIASKKLHSIFEKYNFGRSFWKKINITGYSSLINEFFLYQIIPLELGEVDFSRSVFFDPSTPTKADIIFKDIEEFQKFKENVFRIGVYEIFFKEQVLNNLDYVSVVGLHSKFISNDLADELKSSTLKNVGVL